MREVKPIVPEGFYSRIEEIVDVLHKLNGLTMVRHRPTIDICSMMGVLIAPRLGRRLAELTLLKYVYSDTRVVVLDRKSLEEPLPEDFGTPIEYVVFALGLMCLEFVKQSSKIHGDRSWTDLYKRILYEYLAREERSLETVLRPLYDLESDVERARESDRVSNRQAGHPANSSLGNRVRADAHDKTPENPPKHCTGVRF